MRSCLIFWILGILLAGWILFSLAGGLILYLSTLTTDHASLEPKKLARAERSGILLAPARDPSVMGPLDAARNRWHSLRDSGQLLQLGIVSADGLRLVGYYWPTGRSGTDDPPKAAGIKGRTVLLVHGMMDSAAGMGYLAEEYHAAGWDVLSVDLRAHGESAGSRRTMGVRESEDIALWVELLVHRYRAENIFLHGNSMGGAAVLLYAERIRPLPPEARGLVSDSSYGRYSAVFHRQLKMSVGNPLVAWSLLKSCSLFSFLFSGVPFGMMQPESGFGLLPVPVLLFHGQNDLLVPVWMVSGMLNRAVKPRAELVVVPDAPHMGAYFYAPELYIQKIMEFAGRNS